MGLFDYDNTLFDLLQLPSGLDKDTVISLILTECSDMEVLYPNATVLKNLIGVWSVASQYTWETLYKTTILQYDPITNYDRTETRTLTSAAAGNSTDSGSDAVTSVDSGTDRSTIDTTNTGSVAGFESSSAAPFTDKDKEVVDTDTSTTYGKTNTNTTQYGHITNNTYNKNDSETIRAVGNIGVTTSQQMINQEREVALFNIYDSIVTDFKKRYCILVY